MNAPLRATPERTDLETQAKIDLTAALRMASRMGLGEGICNHFSLAVPGRHDRFLINPQGFHWSELTPADIVTVDVDGNVVAGRHRVEPTAFYIHYRIHRANPKVRAVLHTHMPFATALTLLEGGRLEPVSQTSLKFYGKVAYDDEYNGLVLDDTEGDRIVNCLGAASVLFLASHGVVVTGETVALAFDDLYYLERACMAQVLAAGTGRKLRQIPHAIAAKTAEQMDGDRTQNTLHFEALKRLLDRDEPAWRGPRPR
jgi:ribulose-5-phosphate 4-epimerase/fuculose-1-phosphate aldolase